MVSLAGAVVDDHHGYASSALACAMLGALAVPLDRQPRAARDAASPEAAIPAFDGHGLGRADVPLAIPATIDLLDGSGGASSGALGAVHALDAALTEILGHGLGESRAALWDLARSAEPNARCGPGLALRLAVVLTAKRLPPRATVARQLAPDSCGS